MTKNISKQDTSCILEPNFKFIPEGFSNLNQSKVYKRLTQQKRDNVN